MLAKFFIFYYINNMKNNKFAERLKNLRVSFGFTQSSLGNMVGYNKTAICDWETRGKEPKFDILIKLAGIFNVSTDFLLGVVDKKSNDKIKQ